MPVLPCVGEVPLGGLAGMGLPIDVGASDGWEGSCFHHSPWARLTGQRSRFSDPCSLALAPQLGGGGDISQWHSGRDQQGLICVDTTSWFLVLTQEHNLPVLLRC